ncbi:MAG: hypothetical protein WAV28_19250 [Sedimentisphaerales bacterium]
MEAATSLREGGCDPTPIFLRIKSRTYYNEGTSVKIQLVRGSWSENNDFFQSADVVKFGKTRKIMKCRQTQYEGGLATQSGFPVAMPVATQRGECPRHGGSTYPRIREKAARDCLRDSFWKITYIR